MLDFSSLLVLVRVRKCVELFSPNWRGLTLSSPIRFSSADRRTKSRGKGMDELPKWSHLFTFCVRASGKVCRVIVPKLAGSDFELSHTIFKCWQTHEIHQKRYAFLTIFWQFTGIEWGRWRRCTEWDRLKRCTQERWTFQVKIKLKSILKYDNLC